jgi:HprK-related kinase A
VKHHCRLAVGPAQFRIGSDWARPIAELEALYASYPPPDGPANATVRLFAARPWRRLIRPAVHIGGDFTIPDALPLPLSMGLLAAEMAMNLQMALGWRRHMLLHASAVERGGRALIMSGASGSGKSTMAALLGERADWRLMGDEFTLIDPGSGDALAFPRPVSLKNEAIGVMEACVDGRRFGPLLKATPKGDIRHLVPRAEALAAMHQPAAPALILFPRFGGALSAERIAPSELFVRLTEASTNYALLGEAGFAALTRLVQTVPALAISYPDSESGMQLVEQLWAEAAQ